MSFIKTLGSSLHKRIYVAASILLALAWGLQPAIVAEAAAKSPGLSKTIPSLLQTSPESNLPFLFAVFFVTWAGLFIYAFFMTRRRRQLQNDLRALKSVLEEQKTSQIPPADKPHE